MHNSTPTANSALRPWLWSVVLWCGWV
jgi:hypothetical protein